MVEKWHNAGELECFLDKFNAGKEIAPIIVKTDSTFYSENSDLSSSYRLVRSGLTIAIAIHSLDESLRNYYRLGTSIAFHYQSVDRTLQNEVRIS